MENLEQPQLEGSNEFGKFKDAESLIKAYANLEAEFTKKSQKLATLETEFSKQNEENQKKVEAERKIDELSQTFEAVKPFTSAMKESLAQNQDLTAEQLALKFLSENMKSADFYANDTDFLNKYVFSNKEIKDKIILDYLKNIPQNSPIRMDKSTSSISLTPPVVPTTIQEAGKLAKSIIKNK